ncbi:hypothetical protein [Ruegeria arenilitoris]|nr:hypothetical protein [Ruegeria arenilitoris]
MSFLRRRLSCHMIVRPGSQGQLLPHKIASLRKQIFNEKTEPWA